MKQLDLKDLSVVDLGSDSRLINGGCDNPWLCPGTYMSFWGGVKKGFSEGWEAAKESWDRFADAMK